MKTIHRNDTVHTPRARDAALRRLGRVNRWLIAGTAVLTGVLTDVAANAFPGHTAHTGATGSRARSKHKPLAPPAKAPAPETTATQATPSPAESSEASPPAESQAESAPEPAQEAAPEAAPAEETPAPETQAAAPPVEEPSEPVVSGGS